MLALERQKRILEILNADGSVLVSKLSEELDVTEETIRRDLEKLEKQEVLIRTHGGAVPVDENDYELSLEKRKNTNISAKEKLAKELGDIAWYLAETATALDLNLEDIFQANIEKLKKRYPEGFDSQKSIHREDA